MNSLVAFCQLMFFTMPGQPLKIVRDFWRYLELFVSIWFLLCVIQALFLKAHLLPCKLAESDPLATKVCLSLLPRRPVPLTPSFPIYF